MRLKRLILIGFVIGIAAILVYQIPPVKERAYWGYIQVSAYLRGVVDPAGAVPTPVISSVTRTPAPTATLTPTPAAPTQTPLPSPTPLPASAMLDSPKWEKQDINNCGPASLSMYLNYYGWGGDQFDISSVIKPERADRNVNVEELLHYSRNYAGWLTSTYRVGGDIQLLKTFVANGIPVMIEEGDELAQQYWPDDDMWAGHFLLITGYDDAAQAFTAQDSFRGADRQVSYGDTARRWQPFNYIFILIYHPNQEETVKEILGPHWDPEYNRQHTLDLARSEIDANAEDSFAWFNLGSNLVYYERYDEAADAYDEARRLGLPQRMFRYQFGPFHAYFHSLRTEELLALTDYALKITPNSEEAWLWRGWALYRMGNNPGAIEAFRNAYASNPNSTDAQYALDFMGASP